MKCNHEVVVFRCVLYKSLNQEELGYKPVPTQHSQQTYACPYAGFEAIIPANERPQTHALDPRGYRDRPMGSIFFYHGPKAPSGPRSPRCQGFTITLG